MKTLPLILITSLVAFGQTSRQIEHRYVNGYLWSTSSTPMATVSVAFADTGKYIVAAISVANTSKQRLDVLPEQVELAVTSGRSPHLLQLLSGKNIVAAINRSLAWSALGAALAAQSATRVQTTTSETSGSLSVFGAGGAATGNYNGTTVSTTRVPDTVAQQEIYENQRRRAASARTQAESILTAAMTANTVDPGREYKSAAFFQRDKSCGRREGCALRLQIIIGEKAFSFPAELRKE